MLALIEQHRDHINSLCQKHGVKRLELFGSAASGKFDPVSSDIDFFVEYLSYDGPAIVEQWFGLQEDLERLFGLKVDLTSPRAAQNPYFLEVANRHRVTLYAA